MKTFLCSFLLCLGIGLAAPSIAPSIFGSESLAQEYVAEGQIHESHFEEVAVEQVNVHAAAVAEKSEINFEWVNTLLDIAYQVPFFEEHISKIIPIAGTILIILTALVGLIRSVSAVLAKFNSPGLNKALLFVDTYIIPFLSKLSLYKPKKLFPNGLNYAGKKL